MKSERFTIFSYSIFTSLLLNIHKNVASQAFYTDVDPDVVLDSDLENLFIDMDNNGTTDFILFNWSYTTFSSGFFETRQRLWAGPNIHDNAIAGSQLGSLLIYYPYALSEVTLINEGLEFQTAFFQRIAFKDINTFPPDITGGNWYPEMFDHYLGVRFIGTYGCDHYGWIRCDVMDEGRTLIIKDYAYETKCNIGILAGDAIGDTSTVNIQEVNTLNAVVYGFGNTVFIYLDEIQENLEVSVYDLNGSLLYFDNLIALNAQFQLKQPNGMYIVELTDGLKKFTKKIVIDN
ncbi:MAG: T9SS type A sorting domain-containing protein [Chitinophagales bacterium]|jgi:hypothetical protein|nr:T9SS type A sorting domain-containing protein [Bacteroidota bacterium]MBK7569045.1 T9SS type A sorting domain-containing protein [Bacteroidota bacterium]MBP8917353.1 T9SS type A sorting domain-containing protein [Chitinophagales bacterium]MBP9221463.1 T9SS type A sorting domain-containing protein [Chitinophagales bacterium]MBP9795597.1 T9SS type A sorting domain-containing protein [Chitinophagales bacterium]